MLVSLIPNCNVFALNPEEERDEESAEVHKVTKFCEMVHDKQAMGVPVRELAADETRYADEKQVIESWPIIQAYGLDSKSSFFLLVAVSLIFFLCPLVVGNGFFGMKHRVTIIRE